MFTKKRHLKETIETQGKQIKARDKFIDGQRAEIHAWRNENKKLHNENRQLKIANEQYLELLEKIKLLAESNNYNNEKIFNNKIKELVHDYL